MTSHAHLCLVLHNHQPIGNFDGVFEQAYQDSYLPFLEVFEPYDEIRISLHTSGPLMLWFAKQHPEYLQRVRALVEAGRIEIIGGPFYEPIMAMLPSRDSIGQIHAYGDWLEQHLGTRPAGMWVPERVWEPGMVSDIARAGIEYTLLDDFHFRAAGWTDEQLTGYFMTEDEGYSLRVFPGSERLRYTIPFAPPEETIEYCRTIANRSPGATLVFGDDGEKFGTWPDTKDHVYRDGWLRRFFDALTANRDWLAATTLSQAVSDQKPVGRIYLPNCSYREMTEWSLPVDQQIVYDDLVHELHDDPRWSGLSQFVRGGFWRNFRVKYAEANEMYSRMMVVSRRLEKASERFDYLQLAAARDHLYRGQCNCSYWHGAFGGIYLPHLRNAVFQELIFADNELDRLESSVLPAVEARVDDFNFDGEQEVRLRGKNTSAWVSPSRGGWLYELDVHDLGHNLLATMQRRPEAYHRKVVSGPSDPNGEVASIHDRVVFKQEGLDQRLHYDRFPRKSLMDRFFDNEATLQDVATGAAQERGDFVELPYEAKIFTSSDKLQVRMQRDGNAWGIPISITKAVDVLRGDNGLEFTYLIEGLPRDRTLHFAIEFNFAGMPGGADDRYFYDGDAQQLGHLGQLLDLHSAPVLGLTDRWLGLDVQLQFERGTDLWAFPVETVSQSEGGFELVHQSVCVMPHWHVQADAEGRWAAKFRLQVETDEAAPVRRRHDKTLEAVPAGV